MTSSHDQGAIFAFHKGRVLELDLPFDLSFGRAFLGNRCSATNVEGPHGELSTRFTNRLRRDHTDRLAFIDDRSARQVAAITGHTDTDLGFTGQR